MSYTNPTTTTHNVKAAAISTAATVMSIMGPSGHTGVVRGISAVVTTGVTDAACALTVGNAADADKFGTLSVAVGAAATGTNAATLTAADSNLIVADSIVLLKTDGACTAGAADIAVVIDWFK